MKVRASKLNKLYVYVYVYLHQAEDNFTDFSLWINNSATLGKTKSFRQPHLFVFISSWAILNIGIHTHR